MKTGKDRFKSLLQKIGSGEHTSRGLTREESCDALKLILRAEATPAQIGAFMIAHRIRRPEPQELAGMLDAYAELGPKIQSKEKKQPPICFGMPFDGRNRTAPIYPLTTILLLCADQPVVLHGGKRMPIKYGITAIELFNALGLKLNHLNLAQLKDFFDENNLALLHQPNHFPLADQLISYREELGKRPPLASMELIWTAHKGEHLLISSFVHPPTENRAKEALELMNENHVIFVKGLEGSVDLPSSRAGITGHLKNKNFKRIIVHPHEYGLSQKEIEWKSIEEWKHQAIEGLNNKGPLLAPIIWNAGIYFWFTGITNHLQEGLDKAKYYISSGIANKTLKDMIIWLNKNINES